MNQTNTKQQKFGKPWKKSIKLLVATTVLAGLMISPALAADATQKITLDAAMEKVLANSSDVVTANNEYEKAKIAHTQAVRQSDSMYKEMGRPTEGMMNQNAYAVIVFAPAAKELAMQMAEQGEKAAISGAKLSAISTYYTIASCGKSENAAVDALKKAQTQYNVANSKFKVGMAAKLEVLSAQIQLDNAKIALESARNNTAQNKRNLCVLMGMPVNTQFTLGSTLTYGKSSITDVNKTIEDLVAKSPTVALDELSYKLAELQYNTDMRHLDSFTYNGQIAQKTFDSAKIKYEATKQSTEAAAHKQIEGLLLAEKQYNMAVSSKDLNEEVYRLAVLRYENGLATQNDVLAAAGDLSAVNAQVIGALLQYNIAKTALEQGLITN